MNRERTWNLICKKLAGEATELEQTELEELLRKDPEMHYPIENVSAIWGLPARKTAMDPGIFSRHIERMRAAGLDWPEKEGIKAGGKDTPAISQGRPIRRMLAAAIMVFVLLFSGWGIAKLSSRPPKPGEEVLANANQATEKNEISTRNGSRTKIVLPDGSQVWLNAGSKIKYPGNFGSHIREVELVGEGFFDVVKNPNKPFIIHTAVLDIKVLGTAFNVKSYPADKTTETSLIRGRVEVMVKKRPNEKYILKPNEKLVVLNDGFIAPIQNPAAKPAAAKEIKEPLIAIRNLTYQVGDSTAVEAAWTRNKLSFEDESFEEVAKKLERWYNVQFNFRNQAMQDIHMKGSFTNESLEQAMEALHYSFRFHYEIKNGEVTIF